MSIQEKIELLFKMAWSLPKYDSPEHRVLMDCIHMLEKLEKTDAS